MNPEDYLPSALRGPGTTISRIAAGLSGAGVYRVEAAGQTFVLKVAAASERADDWHRTLDIQRRAADAGLTPRIVHCEEATRAVLTNFVADRSFPGYYLDPRSHEAALCQLGRTVRRTHSLPLPPDAPVRDPHEFLTQVAGGLAGFVLPDFANELIQRTIAAPPPPRERALVLGHNDLNPSNLVYDGASILILDWAAAGPNDPFYDLAVLAVFLRMDDAVSRRLIAAYDDTPCAELPARFLYMRRLVAALAGAMQLSLARQMGHAGASGAERQDTVLALGEFYQQLRAGTIKLGTPDGQWAFGLSLLKAGSVL